MRLTPLDIRKQEFSRGFRGFDADEVNAFLQMVASQWEELQDENRRREEKIRELENKLRHYEKVEEALQEALQTARESSRRALQNAEEKAEMLVQQAESRADEIKREAERERHELKRETVKLSGRRSEIVTRLRAFLMSEMELLARYEGDDPVGFIKLLPAEEKRLRRLSERLDEDERVQHDQGETQSAPFDAVGNPKAHEEEHENVDAPWQEPVDEEDALGLDRFGDAREASSQQASESNSPRSDVSEAGSAANESRRERSDASGGPGLRDGAGWTTRTVVPRPTEQNPARASAEDRFDGGEDLADESDDAEAQRSSEEIEKIRRILSDLD